MNPERIRSHFPLLVENPELAYLDSASSTLIPNTGIDAVRRFLSETLSSSRRGAHNLAVRGGTIVEDVRRKVGNFLGTKPSQISFQKSIPSAVTSFALGYDWKKGNRDTILIAESEEHSVLVPLQRVAQLLNLKIKPIPVTTQGELQIESLENLLSERIGIVAIGSTTVGWGIQNPLNRVAEMVHEEGASLLSDMSRSFAYDIIPHIQSCVDCAIFSANTSLMSPPGLAIQWIDEDTGNENFPGIIGGSGVTNVDTTSFVVALQPDKFESGIINVPAISALKFSIDFLESIGSASIKSHLSELASYTLKRFGEIEELNVYGVPNKDNRIFGFNLGDDDLISCHDIALFLDESNIAVRSGLLCAHPMVKKVSSEGILQASYSIYNTISDIDSLIDTLKIIARDLV